MDPLTNERLQALYREAISQGMTERGPHVSPENLHDLVAQRGTETRRLADLDHVMACEMCRAGFDLLTSIEHAHTRKALSIRWKTLAAAAAVLVAVGLTARGIFAPAKSEIFRGPSAAPTIVAPIGDVTAPAAREFIWRSVDAAIRYDLALLDSVGAVVHSAATTDTVYALPLNIALASSGRYQWVVSAALSQGQAVVSEAQTFRLR